MAKVGEAAAADMLAATAVPAATLPSDPSAPSAWRRWAAGSVQVSMPSAGSSRVGHERCTAAAAAAA